ncbi:hypothetical protein KUCAC02_002196, partial [Chaenocephalus aceratus]
HLFSTSPASTDKPRPPHQLTCAPSCHSSAIRPVWIKGIRGEGEGEYGSLRGDGEIRRKEKEVGRRRLRE